MKWLLIALPLILAALYVLSLRGRVGHPGLEKLRGWNYAHRGLHGNGIPENSLAAFQAAADHGYGAEFDVHLLADGGLGIMHDSQLKRMTGAEGKIESLTTGELANYHLDGTSEVIPTFQQVLEIFDGKAPLVIELKTDNNAAALCQRVCQVLDDYHGVYCLESFDPRCVLWLRRHRPDLIRGQLSYNFQADPKSPLPGILKFLLRYNMENFLTLPDFVAYQFEDRQILSNRLCRKLWKICGVSWTLKNRQQYDTAIEEDWIPIFEGFEP